MEFFKIWRGPGGTIGVNRLTLGDMIGVQFTTFLIYIILLGVAVCIMPSIVFGICILSMIFTDGNGGHEDMATRQRLGGFMLTVIASIYFLVDFHFGLISFRLVGAMSHAETYNDLAILNLTLGLISVILFFVGHEIYRIYSNRLMRTIIFVCFILFGFKYITPISTFIVTNLVTQCVDEDITKGRVEMSIYDAQNTDEIVDERREKHEAFRKEVERKTQERLDKHDRGEYARY